MALCSLIFHNPWVAQAIGNHRSPPGAINNPRWDVPIPPCTAGFGPAVQQWFVGNENRWTARYALWAFHRLHFLRVLMVNFSQTDVLGHFTTDSRVLRYLMRAFDSLLGQIVGSYRRAGILRHTDFAITADHGMSTIRSTLPYSILTGAVAQAGATPVFIEYDTAAAIGIHEDSKAGAVALNVFRLGGERIDAAYFKVRDHGSWSYRRAAIQPYLSASLRSAYQLLMDTAAAASGPDVMAVYAPHVSTRTTVAYGYTWHAGHLGPRTGGTRGRQEGMVGPHPFGGARDHDLNPHLEDVDTGRCAYARSMDDPDGQDIELVTAGSDAGRENR